METYTNVIRLWRLYNEGRVDGGEGGGKGHIRNNKTVHSVFQFSTSKHTDRLINRFAAVTSKYKRPNSQMQHQDDKLVTLGSIFQTQNKTCFQQNLISMICAYLSFVSIICLV